MRVSKAPEVRKKELIMIALELFRNNGYEKTSIEQITNKANVAKGVFYYYFSSKEEIFSACIETVANPLLQEYISILSDKNFTAKERIKNYVEYNFTLFEQKRGSQIEQVLHGQSQQAFHDKITQSCVKELFVHFGELIKDGQASGEFMVDDARFTAAALLGALTAIHEEYSVTAAENLPELKHKIYFLISQICRGGGE